MAKNMTRKGLALGSAAAIVATGLALPANAAGLADTSFISLAPSAGTEYTVLAGANETFTLRANEASTITTGNLKFLVEDANSVFFPASGSTGVTYAALGNTNADVTDFVRSNGTVTVTAAASHGVTVGEIIKTPAFPADTSSASVDIAAGYYTVTAVTSTTFSFVDGLDDVAAGDVTALTSGTNGIEMLQSNIVRASSGNFVVDSGVASSASNEDLILAVMGSSTVSTNVTAWKDANANGSIDSTEYASPVRTVQFIKGSEVTATVTTDPYIVGAAHSTATAYVTTTPALNGNFMSTGDVVVRFTHQGSASNYDVNAAFNTTSRKWSASSSYSPGTDQILAGAHTVAARMSSTTISPVLTVTVVAAKAADGLTAIAEDANNNVAIDGNDDATSTVRAKTLAVSATMSFVDADEAAVPAGRPVKVTVTTITGATGVKVNGTAVAQGDVLDVVTDASGSVTANVTATAANNGATVVLTGVAEGVSGSSTVATFNWTDATYTLHDLNNDRNGNSNLVRSIAKGGSYTFNFAAVDQWAQALSGDYRLKVAVSGNTVSETYPAFAAGSASVTVADAQIADGGDITVVVTPQKKQTDGTWGTTGAPAAVTYVLKPSAQTGAAVTATSTDASVAISTTALAAGDTRTTQATVSAAGTGGTDAVTITGAVTNAITAVAKPGALITVSGDASLLFVNGTKAAFGSLSFYADNTTGAYSVNVRSNKAQKDSVVTVSSQDASKTIKVTFEAAAATSGAAVAIDAPASVTPGSTLVVTVTLTDKFGNPVRNNDGTTLQANNAVNVTYTGPGLIVGSITNLTDANGQITFRVLLGANDTGSASVTAVFQKNTSATTDDISATQSIVIGTAGNTGAYSSWTKKLDDNSAKMYAKNVVGEGKVQFFLNGEEIAWVRAVDATDPKLRTANGSAYLVRTVEFEDGKNVLEIYVDGVRTTRTAYTK